MIDVFICTYNPNHEFLRRTIDGILKQDLNPADWNLTIIDNNSGWPVSEIDFIKKLQVNTIVERKQGLTAARAAASRVTAADLLIFVDDDNILETDYLSTAQKHFSIDDDLVLLSGNITPEYVREPSKWFAQFEPMLAIRRIKDVEPIIYNKLNKYNFNFPIGAGMCIRASFLKDYYQNHLSEANYIEGRKGDELTSSEDIDLDLYAISKQCKLGISPQLNLTHIIPEKRTTVEYITKLAVDSMKSADQINRKWRPVFNETIFSYFDIDRTKLKLKIWLSKLLSFNNIYMVKKEIYRALLKYK